MAKKVKLSDIADKFGVSSVTVSKALSGQKGVSDEMREHIIAYANEIGYKPPSQIRMEMRNKQQSKCFTIAVLIPQKYIGKYDAFYLQMYQQLNAKAATRGCFTLLEAIYKEAEEECAVPNVLREKKADGLIVLGRLSEDYLTMLKRFREVPLLYLDFSDDQNKVDAVVSDGYYGGYTVTKYLIGKGHKKIAYVGTLLSTSSITDRYLGYVKALMEHGIQQRKEWIIDDRYMETGKIDEEKLCQLPSEMPTAFFCNCDHVARIIIQKLNNAGYRVPEDVSVVGYDNYLYPGLCDIEITTYEVDIKEMARKAIDIMISKITGALYRGGTNIIEGHLVEKSSVLHNADIN